MLSPKERMPSTAWLESCSIAKGTQNRFSHGLKTLENTYNKKLLLLLLLLLLTTIIINSISEVLGDVLCLYKMFFKSISICSTVHYSLHTCRE